MQALNEFLINQIAAQCTYPALARNVAQHLMIDLIGMSDDQWAARIEESRIKLGNRNKTEPDIALSLQNAGYSIRCLYRMGIPDIIVGGISSQGRPANWLLKIKGMPARFTYKQEVFMEDWKGQVAVVSTLEEALAAVRG